MAMPPVSNSSPLALRTDHDSVENEKDFALPIKKSKVNSDLVGEEHNIDSVPKVENENDFGPPIKKSKFDNDLVGEEHSTDSVPKVEDEKVFGELTVEDVKVLAKLNDLVTKGVASLKNREIFDMWCMVWDRSYPSQEKKDERFVNFQQNIVAEPTTREDYIRNRPAFADQTKEELEDILCQGFNAFIYKSEIETWPMLAEALRRYNKYL